MKQVAGASMMRWMVLLLLCAACAPRTAPTEAEPAKPIALPGGVVEGRVARLPGSNVVLPETPKVASHKSGTLYVGYPFLLLVYEKGLVKNNVPLPGTPKFIRVNPSLVVGLDNAVVVDSQSLNLKASDALLNREGLYWVDGKALYLNRAKIADGAYTALAGNDQFLYAFARNTALRLPDNAQLALPATAKRAVLMDNLYVLSESGIYRLSPDGLQLGFRAGKFEGLEAEEGRLYTLEDGKLRVLDANLEVA
jgi:hypothetical protein